MENVWWERNKIFVSYNKSVFQIDQIACNKGGGGQSISKYKDLNKVFIQYTAFAKIVYSFSIVDVIN